jgi:hypothetical protein
MKRSLIYYFRLNKYKMFTHNTLLGIKKELRKNILLYDTIYAYVIFKIKSISNKYIMSITTSNISAGQHIFLTFGFEENNDFVIVNAGELMLYEYRDMECLLFGNNKSGTYRNIENLNSNKYYIFDFYYNYSKYPLEISLFLKNTIMFLNKIYKNKLICCKKRIFCLSIYTLLKSISYTNISYQICNNMQDVNVNST